MSLPRVSIRLRENQLQVLNELSEVLNAPISVIIRSIILDWLTKNDEVIEQIITGERPFDKNWINDDEEQVHTGNS